MRSFLLFCVITAVFVPLSVLVAEAPQERVSCEKLQPFAKEARRGPNKLVQSNLRLTKLPVLLRLKNYLIPVATGVVLLGLGIVLHLRRKHDIKLPPVDSSQEDQVVDSLLKDPQEALPQRGVEISEKIISEECQSRELLGLDEKEARDQMFGIFFQKEEAKKACVSEAVSAKARAYAEARRRTAPQEYATLEELGQQLKLLNQRLEVSTLGQIPGCSADDLGQLQQYLDGRLDALKRMPPIKLGLLAVSAEKAFPAFLHNHFEGADVKALWDERQKLLKTAFLERKKILEKEMVRLRESEFLSFRACLEHPQNFDDDNIGRFMPWLGKIIEALDCVKLRLKNYSGFNVWITQENPTLAPFVFKAGANEVPSLIISSAMSHDGPPDLCIHVDDINYVEKMVQLADEVYIKAKEAEARHWA